MNPEPRVNLVVEGEVDRAVMQRLCGEQGIAIDAVHGLNGKDGIRKAIRAYDHAARHGCWIVLVDLDDEAACAPSLLRSWLPESAPKMCLRVAVREVEAWLLADAERLASFLGVAKSRVPRDVEALTDPKETLVRLAGHSRRRDVRLDMVPRPGSGRSTGPASVSRLVELVTRREGAWRPQIARTRSPSLDRCVRDLEARART